MFAEREAEMIDEPAQVFGVCDGEVFDLQHVKPPFFCFIMTFVEFFVNDQRGIFRNSLGVEQTCEFEVVLAGEL